MAVNTVGCPAKVVLAAHVLMNDWWQKEEVVKAAASIPAFNLYFFCHQSLQTSVLAAARYFLASTTLLVLLH